MIAEKTVTFNQSAMPLKSAGLFKKTAQQVESPTHIANEAMHEERKRGRSPLERAVVKKLT